jgi:hypothetical protein
MAAHHWEYFRPHRDTGNSRYHSEYKEYYFPSAYGITDYQLFFLLTLGHYYRLTDDLATMQKYWNQTKDLVAVMKTYIDPYSGLLGTSYDSDYFTAQGTLNATAPTALFVLALRQLTTVGTSVGDTATADAFNTTANGMADAINTLLWNPSLGTYGISITEPDDFSLLAIAFTIRPGVANAIRAASSIAALPSLFLTIGYKDASSAANSNSTARRLIYQYLGFGVDAGLMVGVSNDGSIPTPVRMSSSNLQIRSTCADYCYRAWSMHSTRMHSSRARSRGRRSTRPLAIAQVLHLYQRPPRHRPHISFACYPTSQWTAGSA